MDLRREHFEADEFIHRLPALDVIHDRLGVVLVVGVGSTPMDYEASHLKTAQHHSIFALTAGITSNQRNIRLVLCKAILELLPVDPSQKWGGTQYLH